MCLNNSLTSALHIDKSYLDGILLVLTFWPGILLMENYYKLVEKLANQAGGHYRLSTALIKRIRQLVKGLSSFRSEPVNPVNAAFEEFLSGRLQIIEKPEELTEGKKK